MLPTTAVPVTTVQTNEPVPPSAEEEHEKSMEIFFILLVVGKIDSNQVH